MTPPSLLDASRDVLGYPYQGSNPTPLLEQVLPVVRPSSSVSMPPLLYGSSSNVNRGGTEHILNFEHASASASATATATASGSGNASSSGIAASDPDYFAEFDWPDTEWFQPHPPPEPPGSG